MTILDVIAIIRGGDAAVLSDGTQAPVDSWYDADGRECEPSDAIVAIVKAADCWLVVDLSEFQDAVFH